MELQKRQQFECYERVSLHGFRTSWKTHFFTTNDSDWVWAVGFSLKFSKKKFTKGEKDETKFNQHKFFPPIWHKPDKNASFCNELQIYQVHFDLMTEEIFALNGEFSWFACKENTIEDKLRIVVTTVGFCDSTSAIYIGQQWKKTGAISVCRWLYYPAVWWL